MFRRRFASASALLAAVLATCLWAAGGAAASTSSRYAPEQLRDGFFKVVFGLEYGSRHGDSQRVKKYADTVRFHVINHSRRDHSATVRSFVAGLPANVRGLRTTLVRQRDQANFVVFLVDRDDFATVVSRELKADAIAMNARCLVGVRTRQGRIVSSTAVIVADDPYLFKRCMVEEILQGLGPMNDDDTLSESVFNDSSRHTGFTPFDRELMRILYHPAIRPGMTGNEVHEVLPKVFLDLGYYRR